MPCDPTGVCSPSRATGVCEAFFPTAAVNAEGQPPSNGPRRNAASAHSKSVVLRKHARRRGSAGGELAWSVAEGRPSVACTPSARLHVTLAV